MPQCAPLFFGPPGEQLYGCYHPGRLPKGILICPPLFHEYMRSHWAMKQLASKLSSSGFHVLRFDYRGTGDSACEPSSISHARLIDDVSIALRELRDMSGASQISIVALRGGLIPAEKIPTREPIVAVDGIIDGMKFITATAQMHRERVRLSGGVPFAESELLGNLVPPSLRDEISNFRWSPEQTRVTRYVASQSHEQGLLAKSAMETSKFTQTDDHADWENPRRFEQAIIIPGSIDEVIRAVGGS